MLMFKNVYPPALACRQWPRELDLFTRVYALALANDGVAGLVTSAARSKLPPSYWRFNGGFMALEIRGTRKHDDVVTMT